MRISKNRVLDFLTRCQIEKELNGNRQRQGKDPIPQTSFYRFVNSQKESLTAQRELQWLIFNQNASHARASLSTEWVGYRDLRMTIDRRSRIEYSHNG